MAELADYQWLIDDQFTPPAGTNGPVSKDITFPLPADLSISARGVLSFVVAPTPPSVLRIRVNGVQEVGLKPGPNTIVVERSSGGAIAMSDVVLWFQRIGV